jgi:hypothetical protein
MGLGFALHSQAACGRDGSVPTAWPSMAGRIESGQLCTVVPVDRALLKVGDLVLCKVAGNEYLYIAKAIENGCY